MHAISSNLCVCCDWQLLIIARKGIHYIMHFPYFLPSEELMYITFAVNPSLDCHSSFLTLMTRGEKNCDFDNEERGRNKEWLFELIYCHFHLFKGKKVCLSFHLVIILFHLTRQMILAGCLASRHQNHKISLYYTSFSCEQVMGKKVNYLSFSLI